MTARRSARLAAMVNVSERPAASSQARKRPANPVSSEQSPTATGNQLSSTNITRHFRQTKRAVRCHGPKARSTPLHKPDNTCAGRSAAGDAASPSATASKHASATRCDDHQTNLKKSSATLAKSETSSGLTQTTDINPVFPSNAHADAAETPRDPIAATTTANAVSLETAYSHLLFVEPRLHPYVAASPTCPFLPITVETEPFESLVSCVIGQQVSGAAGRAIKQRFVALFGGTSGSENETETYSSNSANKVVHTTTTTTTNPADSHADVKNETYNDVYAASKSPFPTPSQIASLPNPIATLRTAGLSQRKAEYVLGIANHFLSGYLSNEFLRTASDADVEERLLAVRGLGKWSVDMFCCFSLGRLDIFSTGDLGVQRGMAVFLGRNVKNLKPAKGKWKYIAEEEMLRVSAPFSPYRSLFMWLMWKVEGVDVSFMEK